MREPKITLTVGNNSVELPLIEFEVHTQKYGTWSEPIAHVIPTSISLLFGLNDDLYKKILKLISEAYQ